jgi:hypothetical protein
MLLQRCRLGEILIAVVALKRAMARMGLQMSEHFLFAGEALVAIPWAAIPSTFVGIFPVADVHICEMGGKILGGIKVGRTSIP